MIFNKFKLNIFKIKLFKILLVIIYNFIFLFNSSNVKSESLKDYDLKIIGNNNLDEEYISSILDTKKDLSSDDLINYIIKELFSTGYFETVTAEISQKDLIINLIENPIINNISFRGNNRFNDSELSKLINENLDDINVYNDRNLQEINNLLTQYYKVFGYNLVEIDYSTNKNSEGLMDLSFDITEGEITKIERINIIGNKEANGDLNSTAKLIELVPSFKIWSGNDNDNFHLWCMGAWGAISVTGHLVAKQQKEMLNKVLSGDIEGAAAIHRRLVPLTDTCFKYGNPSTIRGIMRRLGKPIGKPRLPILEPTEGDIEGLIAEIKKYELDDGYNN